MTCRPRSTVRRGAHAATDRGTREIAGPLAVNWLLFFLAWILGGVGAVAGSALGALNSKTALFAGGLLGGVAMAPAVAAIAVRFRWIRSRQFWPTTVGAAIGFIVAASGAVLTLGSPIGPILCSTLTGIGALVGSKAHSG